MKMTNEEIKEVLDAFEQGKEIQWMPKHKIEWITFFPSDYDLSDLLKDLSEGTQFRVKPEPKKIELYGRFNLGKLGYSILDFTEDIWVESDTHKLSYLLDENGEPICDSIKLEKL